MAARRFQRDKTTVFDLLPARDQNRGLFSPFAHDAYSLGKRRASRVPLLNALERSLCPQLDYP